MSVIRLAVIRLASPGGLHADGSDVALIDVEAVDMHLRPIPGFTQYVCQWG